ncbi:MAG: hypothetical protein OXI87_19795 [Albidovulum sp.]|nr:hypothetical protein [Albidovulum sp.]
MTKDFTQVSAQIILQNKSKSEHSEASGYVIQRDEDVFLTLRIEADHLLHIRFSASVAREIGEGLCRSSTEG